MGVKSAYPMVSVEEAQAAIRGALDALPTERIAASAALGRVLREDVHATEDQPAFDASLKDGYAVRACDAALEEGKALRVRGDLVSHAAADEGLQPAPLREGEAAYIATGAPLPRGADAVAMVENCDVRDGCVTLSRWPVVGEDVRARGSDAAVGGLLLAAGATLGAGEVGILAGAGVREVAVTRAVRVGVLSSGDEIYEGDGPLPRGAVRDANRPMLLALVREHFLGTAEAIDLGVVRDKASAVERALADARGRCDVVLTSGGVSMGARDYIKPTLAATGHVHFGRVNMKPGKPLTFASFGRHSAVVALPGNPVSAFVCFHVAAALAVRKLAQLPAAAQAVEAVLSHEFKRDRVRPEFHRVELTWCNEKHRYDAVSTGYQRSSRLLSVKGADALLFIPAGDERMAAGTTVTAHILH